ncbi:MAG: VWA domain-containing protein [Candidatus Woesearchaeota archaeon]
MVAFSPEVEVKELSKAEESQGKLEMNLLEEKLMHSVLQNDKKVIDEGKIVEEAINRGLSAFIPDLLFEQLVKNYSIAKQILGEKLIRLLTGFEPDYLEKNIGIPEFRKELKKEIQENISKLKDNKILDKEGQITDKGVELASLVLYIEELDKIIPKGMLGQKINKKISHYGERDEICLYKKGDRYKDLAIKSSVRMAIKRGHGSIEPEDLKTAKRQSKGAVYVVYGIDASASMKGDKIDMCKKAGVALAYKAISDKDKVGLVVFGSEVKDFVAPTNDFGFLLNKITRVGASRQTDFCAMLRKAAEIFPAENVTKHLIVLTDAMPTVGKKPEEETLKAVSMARAAGITVSIIGIKLDEKGEALAKQITLLGDGRLYIVKNLENIDRVVLEDYYSIR